MVEIEDQLSENLDWSSLAIKSSSHEVSVHVSESGVIQFLFADIHLPDSIVDEPNSHGYVKYTINLKEGLAEGTVIENTADIYFDFNAAVRTNTTTNTLALWASLNETPRTAQAVNFFPNPTHSTLTVSYPNWDHSSVYHVSVYNLLGELVYRSNDISQANYTLNMEALDAGLYLVSVQDTQGAEIGVGRVLKQ